MNFNFKNFHDSILAILGLKEFHTKEGKNYLTAEDKAKLKEYNFQEKFIADFEAHLSEPKSDEDPAPTDARTAVVATLLGQVTEQLDATTRELATLKESAGKDAQAHKEEIEAKEMLIASLNKKIKVLSDMPEPDGGNIASEQRVEFNPFDEKQLGGIAGEFFAMDRPYNRRAQAHFLAMQGKRVIVDDYARTDYKRLNEDLGAYYRTPWQQRLQTFLVKLPDIRNIFPEESGYQDLATLVNIFMGEFSQGDGGGHSKFDDVAKGEIEFGTETLRMYAVKFVYRFADMTQIEKSWIGYLNREHSNPVKLSFVEYLLAEIAKALHNEQQLRFVNGVRKNPDPSKPGRAMEAADGIYEYLRKRIDGYVDFTPDGGTTGKTVYQIKPFDLPEITPGNIGEVFYLGTSMVPAKFRDTGNVVLYVPSWMIPLYNRYNQTKYGQDTDFKGNIKYVKEFPSVKIKEIPNADNHTRIFWTLDGNIHTYCDKPGEMYKFELEPEDWSVKSWSRWKESIQAVAVGYKYLSKTDMDGSRQLIWANQYDLPTTYFIPADKDSNPNVSLHSSVETVANSEVYTITDIEGAETGVTLRLKCGADGKNGINIKKAEKFSLLTEDWEPKKGDIILLMKRADGKFIELGRQSGISDIAYQLAPDLTTPSLKGATTFITDPNTKATAITGFEDAIDGVVYTIYGSGDTNASKIANSGNFVLTEAMTLSNGKFIKLVAANGKFYEIARG